MSTQPQARSVSSKVRRNHFNSVDYTGRIDIKEETIVQEVMKNGNKHYHYTSKYKQDVPSRTVRSPEKENGSVLPSVDRPIRTVIKL